MENINDVRLMMYSEWLFEFLSSSKVEAKESEKCAYKEEALS